MPPAEVARAVAVADPETLLFVTDEHIPVDAVQFLVERGHAVRRSISVVGMGAADPVIASWAAANGAIVVTRDKWFREAIARRPGKCNRYGPAGRLLLICHEWEIVDRLATHMDAIEREHAAVSLTADPRVIVELTRIHLTIER
jgi:hypothetical protein